MQYHVNIGALVFLSFVITGCLNPSQDGTNTDLATITVEGPDKSRVAYESMVLSIKKTDDTEPKLYRGTDTFSDLSFPAYTKVTLLLQLRGAPSDNSEGPIVAQTDPSKGDLCPPVVDRELQPGANNIEMKICHVRPDGKIDVIPTGDAHITIDVDVVDENGGSTMNGDDELLEPSGSSMPPPSPQPDA